MGKAQERIMACLNGELDYSELSEAEQSAIRLPIYYAACNVLKLPTNATMSRALDDLPPTIRELVRVECRRLWNKRGG